MDMHELHHLVRNIKLWRLNEKLARGVERKELTEQFGEFTIRIGRKQDLKQVERLHAQLFREPMLNWLLQVYRFRSSNLLTVAENGMGKIIGYECFMFNEMEIADRILHEVYIGIAPEQQGKGLGTVLRNFSLKTFEFGNLNGLSTVALYDDIKALRSAQRAGFAITKKSLKPPGYYLFKKLYPRDSE